MKPSIKTLLLTGLFLSQACFIQANPNVFERSLNAAKARAVRENKALLLEFTAKWCLPCKTMEKNVYENISVQQFLARTVVVFQVDIDQFRSMRQEYQIKVLPTHILMHPSGKTISRKEESFNAESFMEWISTSLDEKNADESHSMPGESEMEESITLELPLLDTEDFEAALQEALGASATTVPSTKKPMIESQEETVSHGSATQDQNHFYVQAGVFSSRENAENLAISLLGHFKHEVLIAEETRDGKVSYKVRIGRFATDTEGVVFLHYMEKFNFSGVLKQN